MDYEELASSFFGGQTWGNEPYIEHCRRVAAMVGRFVNDHDIIGAAWLHDVVEDNRASINHLRSIGVPHTVLSIVQEVTRRNGLTYQEYIENITTKDGLLLKYCDLLVNLGSLDVTFCGTKRKSLRKRYRKALHIISERLKMYSVFEIENIF